MIVLSWIYICRLYNISSSLELYPAAVACRRDGREVIRWMSSYLCQASWVSRVSFLHSGENASRWVPAATATNDNTASIKTCHMRAVHVIFMYHWTYIYLEFSSLNLECRKTRSPNNRVNETKMTVAAMAAFRWREISVRSKESLTIRHFDSPHNLFVHSKDVIIT